MTPKWCRDKLRGRRRWSRRRRKATSQTPGPKGIKHRTRTFSGSGVDRRPPRKKGKPTTPAASVQLEAPENLLEVLNGASIDEEHRTILSAVLQKVQSAKSGLTEACASLLTGFEVCI